GAPYATTSSERPAASSRLSASQDPAGRRLGHKMPVSVTAGLRETVRAKSGRKGEAAWLRDEPEAVWLPYSWLSSWAWPQRRRHRDPRPPTVTRVTFSGRASRAGRTHRGQSDHAAMTRSGAGTRFSSSPTLSPTRP